MTSAVHDVFAHLRVTVSKTVVKRKCYDYVSKQILMWSVHPFCFVCFVALRPKSTAMVIAGWSVHLTTLFPGQA